LFLTHGPISEFLLNIHAADTTGPWVKIASEMALVPLRQDLEEDTPVWFDAGIGCASLLIFLDALPAARVDLGYSGEETQTLQKRDTHLTPP
jgi:hypothetical protein